MQKSNDYEMSKWWHASVVYAMIPFAFYFLMCLLRWEPVSFERLFGDGELFLSCFGIAAPLVFELFDLQKKNKNVVRKLNTTLLVLVFLVFAYAIIKSNPENNFVIVYLSSAIAMATTIFLSRNVKFFIVKEVKS